MNPVFGGVYRRQSNRPDDFQPDKAEQHSFLQLNTTYILHAIYNFYSLIAELPPLVLFQLRKNQKCLQVCSDCRENKQGALVVIQ